MNNLQYADDTVLIADSEEKLQRLVDKLVESCERKGLRININKTEVMGITKRQERLVVNVQIQGRGIPSSERI